MVFIKGHILSQEFRKKLSLDRMGVKNPNWGGKYSKKNINNSSWLGTSISYKCLHKWVNKYKPKPNRCQDCGKVTNVLHAANISGEYKRDLSDYKYICPKCHAKFDNRKAPENFKYSRLGKKNGDKQKEAARQAMLKRWGRPTINETSNTIRGADTF